MPRRILTSSVSSWVRANRRFRRGISFLGLSASRNSIATSACSRWPNIASPAARWPTRRGNPAWRPAHRRPRAAATRHSYTSTCAACARLSEEYSGLAGMLISTLHCSTISFGRPKRSLPKISAAGRSACAARWPANWRGLQTGRREFAQPRRDGGGEAAAFQRFGHRADDAGAGQDVLGAAGKRHRLLVRQHPGIARIDQHQVGETHGFHGPRDRPDIAGAARFNKDNPQAI